MASDDLAPYLRDWRMEKCEHYDDDICSPCIRDRILASNWLASERAKAWDEGWASRHGMPVSPWVVTSNPYR